ncbi:LPXTG cell wall anchor domain-containing protein [Streptococcus chenjunshii]|uniref:LPXTG cell wall anchor domain-containing protein n=1 Tax=Streptococcus chenjunshii TaxID=2173853 RepID=A0A372KQE2_9STRE|nr:SpaH/EbpB family LPXTG-anchored major pilin [Streptococcus chenjunshii]AXQ77976.1 LPXTG cell wall anchor domain-containing protein [Streptococcus chenjunshii]RFU51780.1 LPXTG cell wall anchor domain-containing protein [Streptococcus chenjunshii]RFU53868.1 LPXTG cell wall anchor domain-containing protein [Streptococcus chenjunshii]
MKNIRKIVTLFLAALTTVLAAGLVSADDTAGSITVSNASAGQEYSVYKLFDATYSADGISYKVPSGKTFTGNEWFDVDSSGNVLAKEGADVSTEAFRTWAESFGTQVGDKVTAENNTVVFNNLPFGYYFVKSSLGATLTVDSTNPDATVIDKNETKPNIPDPSEGGGKKIVVDGNTVSETTAKIGDTVDFQIKYIATNHVTADGKTEQITKYTIKDTPAALNINESSVKVTVGGTDVTTAAAVSKSASGELTVTVPWVNGSTSIYNSPTDVIVTYSAVVTKDAQGGTATNKAAISYDTATTPDNPVDPSDPGDNETTVKTYKFNLVKTDGTKNLTGAQFKLYTAANGGEEIQVVKDGDSYRVAEAGETGVAIEAGQVDVKGLKGDTTYYLEEIKAPDGYNLLTERQAVTFASADIAKVEVVNKAGAELPSTGSIGTTLFYLFGSLLVIGALVFMIAKRRMKNQA